MIDRKRLMRDVLASVEKIETQHLTDEDIETVIHYWLERYAKEQEQE